MKEKRRVLIIGPLTSLIGGDSVSTRNLFRSRYWQTNGFEIKSINTFTGKRILLPGRRLGPADLARFIRIFLQATCKIPHSDLVLLWLNTRFSYSAGPWIILVARLMRKPVIMKPFGSSLEERLESLSPLVKWLYSKTLSMCKRVLAQTNHLGRAILKHTGISQSKLALLPNFIPDRDLASPGFSLREKTHSQFDGRCVFMGQIKREKGVFEIIEALCERSDLICDFYGPIAPRDERAFTNQLEGRSNLNFRGIAEPSDVVSIISGYDVLLLPTWHEGEGQPAVVLQAFAAGVPVIASRWRSIPDLVKDGERGLLIPAKSPHHITAAVDRLASDFSLRLNIIKKGHDYVQSFSERKVVNDILLNEIIEPVFNY